MDTHIELDVRADAQTIYELAAAVEQWPRILPHYRWVHVLNETADGARTVEMAARRDVLPAGPRLGIPVRWTAVQARFPNEPRITFEHVGGVTRGMHVAWTFEPRPDGVVRVAIRHVFEPSWPVLPVLVRLIVGEYFVNGIARRTLRIIGSLAEGS
jgi:ribosome-associated toxin RatA of RatAB toxin-antitoxin module